MSEVNVHVDVADNRWNVVDLSQKIIDITSYALTQVDSKVPSALTIRLSDAVEVQTLNCDYRGQDKPTNVLSFPDGTDVEGEAYLGDVIMAYEVVADEAEEQGKTLADHTLHMAVHGTLHLLGYDHERSQEAEKMEALEVSILAHFGIESPYE